MLVTVIVSTIMIKIVEMMMMMKMIVIVIVIEWRYEGNDKEVNGNDINQSAL